MTADVKLLPLPELPRQVEGYNSDYWEAGQIEEYAADYARANVAHATAALQAEVEALRAEVARLRKMHQDAYQRGLQAGSRGLREMYDAIQEVKRQDAWGNTRLTEALMAAEEQAERAEAENKRLRAAFENLANLRASDIKKEKDAFELWITSKHPGANLSPHQNNCGIMSSTDYMHQKVQAAWDAWLARAALSKENSND